MSGLSAQVEAPTLVVAWKGAQVFTEALARGVAAGIPGARLLTLDVHEAAGQPLLEQFLDGRPVGEATPARREPTATILLTDLEEHTQMMARLGDLRGREVLREHERITRECLHAHGGNEVKTMGDSFICWFTSAQSALECAIAIQTAFDDTEVAGERLSVRVGVNAGEPIAEQNDIWGASVIAAERVKSLGRGGQIMVADVVRQLVAGKGFLLRHRRACA
jgi:class 3 adenylate cyclase